MIRSNDVADHSVGCFQFIAVDRGAIGRGFRCRERFVHWKPPRERGGDIAILAGHFLEQARTRLGLRRVTLAPATIERLDGYAWPGNVRELEHVILRAVLRASAQRGEAVVLEPSDLDIPDGSNTPPTRPATEEGPPLADSLMQAVDQFQRRMIASMLAECGDNWSEAARRLGVDRGNLHRLAKRLGLK